MEEKGTVYWFTGLSGAGKTTLGQLWYSKLKTGKDNVIFLDGDQLREVFGGQLGYSGEDRLKLASSYGRLCAMLAEQGMDVVCCTISMFDAVRQWNRDHIPGYWEIYVKASMETLRRRDQKGLYSKNAGQVAGLDLNAELPRHPDVVLNNDGIYTPEQQVEYLTERLEKQRRGRFG